MANQQSYYFYPSTWDYPPNGPIKLGNVLTSVKKPERPLLCSPPTSESDIFTTQKRSVQYTKEKMRSGMFSILTRFLSILGLGIDIGAEADKTDTETFLFESIDTIQFVPTRSYLQTCVEGEYVRKFLRLSSYRKPLYVITGIKVVTGAEANTLKARAISGFLGVEADAGILTGGTVPVAGGPQTEARASTASSTKWGGSSDFIFAFRVSKIEVSPKSGQISNEEEYTRGAMLDEESSSRRQMHQHSLETKEIAMDYDGYLIEEQMDGDGMVLCALSADSVATG